ncbi:MAG: hypothetical protein N3A59_07170 [Thermodesulfovibrionales bacterium]|nr:hypothetical protein [Thermodesulfovibrionales bacterium]
MKPDNLKTKIFLDSGDPKETRETLSLLGFLDGQTTNPSLIAKSSSAQERISKGLKFSKVEVKEFYRDMVSEISGLIPSGSVSIEVYADLSTSAKEMLDEAQQMYSWIPNAHIKIPITKEGLKAAEIAVSLGMRLNLTLCFSQEQAAAVYSATKGAPKKGDIFVSPFIGRLDDKGLNGMDLISNIIRMYRQGDGHVEILAASIRNLNHLLCSLWLGVDIVTAPFKVLKEWVNKGLIVPDNFYQYDSHGLSPLAYCDISLDQNWQNFNIHHPFTDKGLESFVRDWKAIIE